MPDRHIPAAELQRAFQYGLTKGYVEAPFLKVPSSTDLEKHLQSICAPFKQEDTKTLCEKGFLKGLDSRTQDLSNTVHAEWRMRFHEEYPVL